MVHIWLGIVAALLLQEVVSTAAALVAALRLGLNLWIVNGIWLAVTVLEVLAGYYFGKWMRRKSSRSRISRWADKISENIGHATGEHGKRFFVFSLAFLLYVWMAGFIAAWMEVPLGLSMVVIVLGDLIWYGFEWSAALGVNAVSPNFETAVIAIIVLGVAFTLVLAIIRKRRHHVAVAP